jgi:hypothetical protein
LSFISWHIRQLDTKRGGLSMAGEANTPRKASAKLLRQQVDSLKLVAGILIKATRAYKSAADPDGATQTEVGRAANPAVTQPQISNFENGTFIPADPQLSQVLGACGFDLTKPGAGTLVKLLQFIRDNEAALGQLEGELPE